MAAGKRVVVTMPRRDGDPRFRPDLEGLRGIAILLVLLCHAGVPGAEAGFVGVDIFFVLSGFLITGLLVGERERTGRISLRGFYARRARRILPAALLVLASTLVVAQLVLSPLDLPRIADDGLAAGLSLANVRFALDATDYFAPVAASPMLHFWSLAVEEQFYLLWPLLLLAATRVRRPRLALTVLATAILVASFALCVVMTEASGPWAYFSLPTRAWQLAAGGLLALTVSWHRRAPTVVAVGLGWAGVGLIGAGLVLIGPTTAYPGFASLLPTLGALAIIASGGTVGTPGWVAIGRAPLRWLGRISYSLYLWHWPILVLGPVALGLTATDDGVEGADLSIRLGLIGLAVLVAAFSWWLVEEPFRRGPSISHGRVRGLAMAGTAAMILVVVSTSTDLLGGRDVVAAGLDDPDPGASAAWIADATSPSPGRPRSSDATATGSGAVSLGPISPVVAMPPPTPSSTAVASPASSRPTKPASPPPPSSLIEGPLPRNLKPSLAAARTDEDPLLADGCGLGLAGSRPPECVYGDPHGAVTVALVGDSHAAHWFPALESLARQRGWRLVPYTKFSCAFLDLPIWSPYFKREYTECEAWRDNVVDRLVKLRPDLVVVASDQWFPVIDGRDNDPERQGAAMARLLKPIRGAVAIMVDTPRSDYDVPACLAQHPRAIERCTTTQAAAFGWRHGRREKEAARLADATLVDLTAATCPVDPCPPIIGTTVVYRDHHHLTVTFVMTLVDELGAALPVVR